MKRSLLFAAAALAFPALATAQADTRPIVVVFTFTNSSIGPARADFDGVATGIQDLLISDLASSTKVRVVDRARISEILAEQNMVKNGQVDPETAVRLGKILGAQYAITGGFIADKSGNAVMTGRTIDIETTLIANPQKITGKADDVLGMIAQLSSKIGSDVKVTPKGAGGAKSAPAQSGSSSASSKSAQAETYAKALPTAVVEKTMKTKLDAATMKLYSRALDEIDAKNTQKAAELLRQVRAKFPDFEPAQRNLDKLANSGD
jgi:TolB-like protein